ERVADLRYFNSLELEVDSLKSQLETQKTQFLNEIDRLLREYYSADHMNALSVYTKLDKVTNLQCDYLETLEKCEFLEKEPSKRVIPPTSVSRPQLKSNQIEDRVMINNSQGKKQEVEDHHRNVKFSKNKLHLVEIILFIIDSGCSKHMNGNLKLLTNFVEKFLGTVRFRNDQIAPILGYRDLVQGAVTIKRVYYVEGLNHNLFSIGSRGTGLYSITLQDTSSPNPICLMAKASSSQAWLWHRIHHQTSVARTSEQKSIVERQNHTLVEAARTMLSAAKVPLFFFAEKITTAYGVRSRQFCLVPQCQSTALEHDSLSLGPQCQENVPHTARTVITLNKLYLLFSPMFDELLNGSTQVVPKSSAVTTVDAPNQCQQQHTTPLHTQTTPDPTCQVPTQASTVSSTENINQAETIEENAQVEDDEFIKSFVH
nr:hypothetical protein [Tanacetum cinerariifolium]